MFRLEPHEEMMSTDPPSLSPESETASSGKGVDEQGSLVTLPNDSFVIEDSNDSSGPSSLEHPLSDEYDEPQGPLTVGQTDLGQIVEDAKGSWDTLRSLIERLPNHKIKEYLSCHFKPSSADTLHSHPITKAGKTWNVSFQRKWLQQFPWLSYSPQLSGGICRYCVLFPQQPERGEKLGSSSNRTGILVLSAFKYPFSKALGKDGVLVCHNITAMHRHATIRADTFLHTYFNPSARIDSRLMKQQEELAKENKHILQQIILAIEFLAKQGLSFRGHRDDKVDFTTEDLNRGNFVATLQLMAKNDPVLKKHLTTAKKNCKYTSKTIQNQIVHIYANKIRVNRQICLGKEIYRLQLSLMKQRMPSLIERY